MRREKLLSLTKYLTNLTNRLTAPLPEKHKDHPETYKQFLDREIATVKAVLEADKLK